MRNDRQVRRTCLFVVRLWLEPLDDSRTEIRGEVRHISSGERRYVRTRAALEAFFIEKLSEGDRAGLLFHAEWFTPEN